MFIKGGYPLVGYYIEDGDNMNAKEPFRCRVVEEGAQFFSQPASGLIDVGMQAQLITPKKLNFTQNSKVIWNDVLYSVESIMPFIPDPASDGLTKRRVKSEYLIVLV